MAMMDTRSTTSTSLSLSSLVSKYCPLQFVELTILVLCYWGTSCYFAVAAIHTFSYAQNRRSSILNRLPRPLQALHHLFWTSITTFPLLVTIVYWGVLYSGFTTTFAVWSNVSQHALNTVFGLFELFVTRIDPAPWVHLVFLIVILACYCALAYVTYATKGYFVYSFLNPNPSHSIINSAGKKENIGGFGKGGVVGAVFGIALAIIVLFCVTKGLVWLRKWATEDKMGMNGKFMASPAVEPEEIEMGDNLVKSEK